MYIIACGYLVYIFLGIFSSQNEPDYMRCGYRKQDSIEQFALLSLFRSNIVKFVSIYMYVEKRSIQSHSFFIAIIRHTPTYSQCILNRLKQRTHVCRHLQKITPTLAFLSISPRSLVIIMLMMMSVS